MPGGSHAPQSLFQGPELWLVDLEACGPALGAIEAACPRLSEDDLVRLEKSGAARVRHERRLTRIALRLLLERAFGRAVRAAPYHISEHGKPSLSGTGGAFSVSHIAGTALIGIARERTVGVDLECRRVVRLPDDRRRQMEAAAHALAPDHALPDEGEARFLQAWVRLEAAAKAEGRGIGALLDRLGATKAAARAAAATAGSVPASALGLSVYDCVAGPGMFAAVALPSGVACPPLTRLPHDAGSVENLIHQGH